ARRALEHAAAVHSIDTPRLLEALSRLCGELGREIDVFLELRAIETGERTGFGPDELPAAVELAARLPHLRLRGLMAMAAPDPLARAGELSSQSNARRTFASVRELGSRLPVDAFVGKRVEYSMGMSGDLEAAIQEGAHWVRIGTALFENVAEERP
ncbi:MAG: alanine racemase, partial [Planctomycetota bacterium]|nr:alanine racemase [Planctomycetota bacterium]